jgi:hypothetical protein
MSSRSCCAIEGRREVSFVAGLAYHPWNPSHLSPIGPRNRIGNSCPKRSSGLTCARAGRFLLCHPVWHSSAINVAQKDELP